MRLNAAIRYTHHKLVLVAGLLASGGLILIGMIMTRSLGGSDLSRVGIVLGLLFGFGLMFLSLRRFYRGG